MIAETVFFTEIPSLTHQLTSFLLFFGASTHFSRGLGTPETATDG